MKKTSTEIMRGVSPRRSLFWLITMGPASLILCVWPLVKGMPWFWLLSLIFLLVLALGELLRFVIERRRRRDAGSPDVSEISLSADG